MAVLLRRITEVVNRYGSLFWILLALVFIAGIGVTLAALLAYLGLPMFSPFKL